MTWAVSFDFHNTIAACDAWFQIEVYDLIPAFLDWHALETGRRVEPRHHERGRALYRDIRKRVMASGNELDAAACVAEVFGHLELVTDAGHIERGLDAIFRPTLVPARPMPGVVESVRALRERGVTMTVVSSAAYHPFLEWTLEGFGIRDCFDDVLTSAACGHYKSTSRIYELAAERLGRHPAECIHIGDSEQFDVLSAANAGMRTVLVDWQRSMDGESTADLRVETLCGLPERLEEAFGSAPDAV